MSVNGKKMTLNKCKNYDIMTAKSKRMFQKAGIRIVKIFKMLIFEVSFTENDIDFKRI